MQLPAISFLSAIESLGSSTVLLSGALTGHADCCCIDMGSPFPVQQIVDGEFAGHFVWTAAGRLRCRFTGHEIPATEVAVRQHAGSKACSKLVALKKYEPLIVPSTEQP